MNVKEQKLKKNDEIEVDIIDTGYEGEGIAKINDFIIFIPNVLKGEKVKIKILKVNKSYAYGKALEIIKSSDKRVKVACPYYSKCGGCDLRHTTYENTLEIKKNYVEALVKKTLGDNICVNDVVPANNSLFYRNKLALPITSVDNELNLGIFSKRSHNKIAIDKCYIFEKEIFSIAKDIVEIAQKENISAYDETNRKGIFRHIVVRKTNLDQTMATLVLNTSNSDMLEEFKTALCDYAKKNNITSIAFSFNTQNTNVILGTNYEIIYGTKYITDELNGKEFQITPLSFYQVNHEQVEKLYNLAIKKANLKSDDIVFDLYCGTGTIGLSIADKVKHVYGVEIIDEAIQIAKENAKNNKIDNATFYSGDATKILDKLLKEDIIPDVVILDPPRKGIEKETIENLKSLGIKKIIYISCNPKTLFRDLKLFEDKYFISDIDLVDMFCYSKHVECVTVLNLK